MHLQFIAAIQGNHHGDGNQAARFSREAWTRPYLAPGIASDQILKDGIEFILGCLGALDVRFTQHRAADFQALFVAIALIHAELPYCARKLTTWVLKSSWASILDRCAAFTST